MRVVRIYPFAKDKFELVIEENGCVFQDVVVDVVEFYDVDGVGEFETDGVSLVVREKAEAWELVMEMNGVN